jgi:hypothetical protein
MKAKNSKQLLLIFLLMLTLTSFAITSNDVTAYESDCEDPNDGPVEPAKPVVKPPHGAGGPGGLCEEDIR